MDLSQHDHRSLFLWEQIHSKEFLQFAYSTELQRNSAFPCLICLGWQFLKSGNPKATVGKTRIPGLSYQGLMRGLGCVCVGYTGIKRAVSLFCVRNGWLSIHHLSASRKVKTRDEYKNKLTQGHVLGWSGIKKKI